MRRENVFGTKELIFLLLFAAVCTFYLASAEIPEAATGAAEVKNPFDGNSEAVAAGRKIFDDKCSECHGTGTGGSGPDLTDNEWVYGGSDAEVFASVSKGRRIMPAWEGELGTDDIWRVIAFLRSIKAK